MLVLQSEQIRALASMQRLIEGLQGAFGAQHVVPERQIAAVPGGAGDRLLLQMPAFDMDGSGVVKLAMVFPDNPQSGRPTIQSVIVVFSSTGTATAILDGTVVTRLRTGAASALASTYLSRQDSAHLVVIGTGALAPYMAWAHCTVRPIVRISVCGRRPEPTDATVAAIRSLVGRELEVRPARTIEEAVATADVVSCATSCSAPILSGRWLKAGTFVDLVGSFSPSRREADDAAVQRARIFVDTFAGALSEAGDILDPLQRGVIQRQQIEGELADLVLGRVNGRATAQEITVFKSVGTAIEDLAAAQLIVAACGEGYRP